MMLSAHIQSILCVCVCVFLLCVCVCVCVQTFIDCKYVWLVVQFFNTDCTGVLEWQRGGHINQGIIMDGFMMVDLG